MTTADPRVIDASILTVGGKPSNLTESIEIPDELTILTGSNQPQKGWCSFRLLSPIYGDQRVTWDSASLKEINAARRLFIDLVKRGLKPHKVGVNGQKTAELMTEFDPTAEEVIFVPMALVVGG